MCIRDRYSRALNSAARRRATVGAAAGVPSSFLSLIHISEPTRLRRISYAVFCLKKKRRPQRSTQSRSSAASDVYKRQVLEGAEQRRTPSGNRRCGSRGAVQFPVSYTHLRAHETKANLVCRLLLEKK